VSPHGTSKDFVTTLALAGIFATSRAVGTPAAPDPAKMKSEIDNLMALQELKSKSPKSAANRAEQIEALRSQIPESLLRTFDRFVTRGKKAVAIVHKGVCSECHLQIAVGVLGSLAFGHGVQQCGNCARFLFLPEDEPVLAHEASGKPKTRQPHKEPAAQHA